MPKLTKRFVEAAETRAKMYEIYDSQIPRFSIRILPSGRRTYSVMYSFGGRRWRVNLGRHGIVTPEQARDAAIDVLARVARGENPTADKRTERQATTVADLADRFEKEHIVVCLRPSSAAMYRCFLRLFILPAFGDRKVIDVTRTDIARLHHELRDKPYEANRTLAVISKMFNLAELWGLRPDGSNPCRHVNKYPEEQRERYLSVDELMRLGKVLDQCERERLEGQSAIDAIRLLIFTGCRRSEILTLKWDYVDLKGGALHLPDSKTGKRTVHIGEPALRVLKGIEKRADNPWVIVGRRHGSHLVNLRLPWQRIRARAGLDDVRIHDLRHTFASFAVSGGQGLPMIGKMLGHTQVKTTARYAHLATDPVKRATEDVSASIEAALEGGTAT